MNKDEMLRKIARCDKDADLNNYYKTMDVVLGYMPDPREDSQFIQMSEIFGEMECGEAVTIEDIEEGDYNEKTVGYTYNFSGYGEYDFQYYYYADAKKDIGYAVIELHIGGDARANFAHYFVLKYDSADEYGFLTDIGRTVARNFNIDGIDVSVDIYCTRDVASVYVNGENDDQPFDECVDMYSTEYATNSLREILIEKGLLPSGDN